VVFFVPGVHLWELCQCAITTMRARYAMGRVVALWHRGSRGSRRGGGGESSGTGTGSGMTRNLPLQGKPTIRCKQTTDQEGIPPHKEARLTARQLNSFMRSTMAEREGWGDGSILAWT